MSPFEFYVLDTETTGFDITGDHSPIEISIIRYSTNVQKTWLVKPINTETIDAKALKVNGHKLEDITHKTSYGKENYLEASKVIVDIENWIAEDLLSSEDRILVGQNIAFDKYALMHMWKVCNCTDSFPFGRKSLDTMQLELILDLSKGKYEESYSLNSLIKRYNVKNEKAHTAASDTLATKNLFEQQLKMYSKLTSE